MATKFSEFNSVSNLRITDIVVGLRSSTNTQFTFNGIIENSNGATIFKMVSPGDLATNYPQMNAALTGNDIIIEPAGSDASIGMTIRTKVDGDMTFTCPGTGDFNFNNTGGGLFVLNSTTGITGVLDEDNMSSDSATHVATQQSTKAYVDSSITSSNAYTYVTNLDNTANLPNSQPLASLSSGFSTVTTTTGIIGSRILTGTSNQIDVSNGDGTVGNPVWSLSSTIVFPGTIKFGTGATLSSFLDEDDMASNSATAAPTQQSVKAYSDARSRPGFGLTVLSPTTTDEPGLGYAIANLTINTVVFVVKTSGTPSIDITLNFSSDRSDATPTEVISGGSTVTSTTTGSVITSFTNASLTAGDYLWPTFASITDVDQVEIYVFFTYDV